MAKIFMMLDDPRVNTGYAQTNRLSIRWLRRFGHEVACFSLNNYQRCVDANAPEVEDWNGVPVYNLRRPSKDENETLYGTREFFQKKFDELRPDVMLFHNDFYRQGWFFDLSEEAKDKSAWWMPIDVIRAGPFVGGQYVFDIKNMYFVTQHAADILGYKNPRVIHHAIDEGFFEMPPALSRPRDVFQVCRVDRHQPRKQWPYALDAFAKFAKNKKNVHFLAKCNPVDSCGFDPDLCQHIDLRELTTRVGGRLEDVTFLDADLSTERLIGDVYDKSHVFLTTTGSEGFGLGVAEAMARGCVPIFPIGSSLPEVVVDPSAGYPYEYSEIRMTKIMSVEYGRPDPVMVAMQLESAFDDWIKRNVGFEQKSKLCREIAAAHYHPKDIYRKWNEEIQRLTASNNKTIVMGYGSGPMPTAAEGYGPERKAAPAERNYEIENSIIIPTFNHLDDCLKPCVASVLRNTDMSRSEIIVVANGCIDGTKEYLESMKDRVRHVWCDSQLGYVRAVNEGIKAARGKFITLLNNDVTLFDQNPNEWLEIMKVPFEDPKVGITGPQKRIYWGRYPFIVFFCCMLRRSMIDEIGLLDEDFGLGLCDDIEYAHRAMKAGYKLVRVPENSPGQYPAYHPMRTTFNMYGKSGLTRLIVENEIKLNKKCDFHPRLSIVIPTSGHLQDCLDPCIKSVANFTHLEDVEVIVVVNQENPGEIVDYLTTLGPKYRPIVFDKPIGYTAAANAGMREARGDYVMLLNNDTIVLEQRRNDWVDKLLRPFEEDPQVGLTGPHKLHCVESGRDFLVFYCVVIKREVIDKIGYLDEIFNPGSSEDIDYCHRAENAGFKLVQVDHLEPSPGNSFLVGPFPMYHRAEATVHEISNWSEIFRRNLEIIRGRYGTRQTYDQVVAKLGSIRHLAPEVFDEVVAQNVYGVDGSEIKGRAVLDVGANVGMFSALADELGALRVLAVEPHPANFEKLLTIAADRPNIRPHRVAAHSGLVRTVKISGEQSLAAVALDGTEVETASLHDLLSIFPDAGNDLILKCDCEGSEFDILLSASAADVRRFERIYIEVHEVPGVSYHGFDFLRDYMLYLGYGVEREYRPVWYRWDVDANGNRINEQEIETHAKVYKFVRK